jgi:hypothetical protein
MNAKNGNRDAYGRFVQGHPGGPGRPRRYVEQEYLAALNAAVSLETWRQIIERAIDDAIRGDSRAREWLSQYLLGEDRVSLVRIAAKERVGLSPDAEIDSVAIRELLWQLATAGDGFRARLAAGILQPHLQSESNGVEVPEPARH